MQKKAIKQLTREDIEGLNITHKSDIPPLEPIITVDGKIYAFKGGLSMVTGKTGSGKSTVLRLFISLALLQTPGQKTFEDLTFDVTPANGKPVIYLNTEMPDSSLKRRVHDAVLHDLDLKHTPPNFKTLQLIDHSYEERKEFISKILELYPDTHLLLIDGGADTVSSVNEEKQSVDAIEELNQLANRYKTTIINVVHENKGNGLSRGHYGQHSERKSSGVMSVEYDKKAKMFNIKSVKIREMSDFDTISFQYDERGNIMQTSATTASQRMNEAKEDDLLALVLDGFKVKERWKLSEFKKWIAERTKMSPKTGGRRVDEMFTAAYITTDGTGYIKSLVPVETPF